MLTPASGIVRSNFDIPCTECREPLTNVTRYPGPVMWRCLNRNCAHCALPRPGQPSSMLFGVYVNARS